MNPWRQGVAVVTWLATTPANVEMPQQRGPSQFGRAGTFKSPRLRESSGVAVSRHHPGLLWTHNDSGDGPYLYATTLAGDDLGSFRITGAEAVDWEDLSLGRCPDRATDCLYIADTGDNLARRRHVTIYIVPEPERPATDARATDHAPTAAAHAVRVRYPDRPHDVEAIWVEPGGAVILVTKGTDGPILRYALTRSALLGDSAVARLVDTLAIVPQPALARWVTGAAISPSGRRVVIRTYTELYFFRRQGIALLPEGGPCWLGLAEPQGEAVAFLTEETLVLTSEAARGQDPSIHTVRCDPPPARRE